METPHQRKTPTANIPVETVGRCFEFDTDDPKNKPALWELVF